MKKKHHGKIHENICKAHKNPNVLHKSVHNSTFTITTHTHICMSNPHQTAKKKNYWIVFPYVKDSVYFFNHTHSFYLLSYFTRMKLWYLDSISQKSPMTTTEKIHE